MLAPPATPKAIVDKLNRAANEALADPAVRQQLASLGALADGGTPQQFSQFLVQDRKRWADVIKKGNVKGE